MARHYVSNAAPSSPAEMAEALYHGTHGVTPQAQAEFRDAYTAKMVADGSLDKQIKIQTQAALGEFLKAGGNAGGMPVTAGPGRSARATAMYNKAAPGAKADAVFADSEYPVAEFFQAVSHRRGPNQRLDAKLAKLADIQNSFGSEVPDAGGFLVPEILRSELLMMSLEQSIVRRNATVIPMNSLRVPVPMIDDTTHASNVFGGIQFYWTEEAAAITESQASFGRVVLDAKKLAGYFAVPNELLQDAPAFGAFFSRVVPAAHSWFEDVGFMTGTGVGEPEGFVNCPASVAVAKEAGQPTQTIVYENLCKMWSRLLPQCQRSAVWVANVDVFPQLATMALSVGTGGGPVWIGGNPLVGGVSAAEAPPVTIFGRPLYFTEKLPALGTTGDICLADFGFYLVGDRMQLELSSSEHFLFSTDKVAYRLLNRVDGHPWLQSALTTHQDSTNTLSAFVQLASR